jgi:hypothetical protein
MLELSENCHSVTRYDITENNNNIPHAKDTTAPQPNVFFYWNASITFINGMTFHFQTTSRLKLFF